MTEAAGLLQRAGARHVSPACIVAVKAGPAAPGIGLRFARVAALLGLEILPAEIRRLLKSLAMKVVPARRGLTVWPPSFRFDVKAEIDLVEEIARLFGYDQIPDQDLPAAVAGKGAPEGILARAKRLLIDRGYSEVMTFSLVDAVDQEALGFTDPVVLRNPLAGPWSTLRRSLLPGLLRVAQYNRNRQQNRVRIFELGRCYERAGEIVREELRLAGLILGPRYPEHWANPRGGVDFFDIKGDVEVLAALLGRSVTAVPCTRDFLQGGQGAALMEGGTVIGHMGALHPRERARLGFDEPVYLFELVPEAHVHPVRVVEPPRFPAIRRDLALVVDTQVTAADVLKTVREAAGPLLQELVLFDVYQGEGLDLGKKSLALGLTLQDFSRTLKDEVVDDVMARTLDALETACGAQLRQRL